MDDREWVSALSHLECGRCGAVSDEEIAAAQAECAAADGVLMCPEGAATVAAVHRLRERQEIGADDEIVLLNTGAAANYADTLRLPEPVLLAADATLPD